MRLYALMQNLNWPKTYVGRIFLLCFVGTHIPLIALIAFAALRPNGSTNDIYWTLGVALLATVVAAGFTFYAVAAMLRPVLQATKALDRYVVDGVQPDLPMKYGDDAGKLMASVQSTVVKLGSAIEELTMISITDPLTGARNRRWLSEVGVPEFQRIRAEGGAFSLLTLDIDSFKAINDAHGHTAGDQILMSVTDAVRGAIRSRDQLVRTGGDEFCVLMPEGNHQTVSEVADRIQRRMAAATEHLGVGFLATLSIGGATASGSNTTFTDLYRLADRNLYAAKNNGRDGVVSG